jgi:hypothetical protein
VKNGVFGAPSDVGRFHKTQFGRAVQRHRHRLFIQVFFFLYLPLIRTRNLPSRLEASRVAGTDAVDTVAIPLYASSTLRQDSLLFEILSVERSSPVPIARHLHLEPFN